MEPLTREDILNPIADAILNQPRSLQTKIGPSELGLPCARRLIHKIAGEVPPERSVPWKPYIGTAMHTQLEQVFKVLPGWHTERKVSIGMAGDEEITGHSDLFHEATGTVIDWKLVSKSRIATYRHSGPGMQYETQGHCYGRGWQREGYEVHQVKIVFLSREGEFKDAHIWTADYDEEIAVNALARYAGLKVLVSTKGKDAASALFEPCTDWYCPVCGSGSPKPKRTGGTLFNPTYE